MLFAFSVQHHGKRPGARDSGDLVCARCYADLAVGARLQLLQSSKLFSNCACRPRPVVRLTYHGAGCAVLSPRELATRFTDAEGYLVWELSVYRFLKARDLITSPAFVVIKAADVGGQDRGSQPALADRLHLPQGHRLGMVLPLPPASPTSHAC